MEGKRLSRLKDIQNELLKISQAWAGKRDWNPERAALLRREAVLINHHRYLEGIPVYQKLAREAEIGELDDIEPIKRELMSTDDIFKSYNQEWLDSRDFKSMNEWLSGIFHEMIDIDVEGVNTIDEWIERLTIDGIIPAYSSGTTGAFSFVPRDRLSWYLFTDAPVCYLTPTLIDKGLGKWWQNLMIEPAAKLLSIETFVRVVRKMGLPDYDGFFLNFRKGNMGIQLVGQELSKIFPGSYFLYDIDLSASALRCITRGLQSEEDQRILEDFTAGTIGAKMENYDKIINQIRKSTKAGQKIFLFGAPYQLRELAEIVSNRGDDLRMRKGSFILFGGGWKTFEGDRIDREELVNMVSGVFDVPSDLIVEGYSMTEINGLFVRCDHGRFHMPPVIEPVILDEELVPLEGDDVTGAFGFLDPFAVSYPGFIISGDNVRLIDKPCECGMRGPAILQIERSPGREVKGCGEIMASVKA